MAMFSKTPPTTATKKPKAGKDKEQLQLSGIEDLAVIDAVIKQAEAIAATLKAKLNDTTFDHFASKVGQPDRPSSFEGIDGNATASLEIRKRSANSVLSADEVAVLAAEGITAHEEVIKPFLFHINEKYAGDTALLGKVEAALAGIVPDDFIQQQVEIKKYVVSDAMLDELFRRHPLPGGSTVPANEKQKSLLKLMVTMAVKPKLTDKYDMNNLLTDAFDLMK